MITGSERTVEVFQPPKPASTSLYVDGRHRPSSTNSTFEVRNPFSKQVVGICASASSQDCRDAVDAAQRAFTTWEHSSLAERRDIFLRAADLVSSDKYKKKVVNAMCDETAATVSWGMFQWAPSATYLRSTAAAVSELKGETCPSITGGHMIVQRRAKGVMLAMAPWNAPFSLTIRAVALPIICGNTVVLKPSEYSPSCQAIVTELFEEAGLPKGVLNFIPMSRDASPVLTAELIANPNVRALNFTGSDRVGRILAAQASKFLKPVVLELGGKAPMIVLNDANLEDAARAVVYGAMANSGQVCMSTERVIVQRDISYSLVSAVANLCRSLRAGDPIRNALSPLFTDESAANVLELIQDAMDKGAELVMGNLHREGSVVQPHLLTGAKPGMNIWHRETFGPVTIFAVFDNIDEAIELANDSDFTLAASLWTSDVHAAMNLSARIRSGYTNINGTTFHSEPSLTVFGLGGSSGYGRFDVEHFTDKRCLVFHPPNRQYPLLDNFRAATARL